MERLAENKLGQSYPLKDKASSKVSLFTDYDGFYAYFEAVNRLGCVEDILGDDYDLDRLRELVEADKEHRVVILSEPMKPMIWKPGSTDVYCPNCGNTLSGGWPLSDADDWRKLCQCPKCGQSIDDTKAESALDNMKEAKS